MFQDLLHTITTFIMVTVVTVAGVLHRPTFTPNKPIDFSLASSSATISESPKPTTTPSPTSKPSTQLKQKTVQLEQTDTLPASNLNTQPKTYSIIPIGDLSSLSSKERQQMVEIYNELLKTPNLQYLTPQQQEEVFKQKMSTYLDNYKRQLLQEESQLKENVSQLKQQLNQIQPTSAPTPVPFQSDPVIIAKLDELRQTLINIQGATVAMNIIEGRKQAAYQKWMQDNFDAYSVISGNSYYLNLLNSIRRAYGV